MVENEHILVRAPLLALSALRIRFQGRKPQLRLLVVVDPFFPHLIRSLGVLLLHVQVQRPLGVTLADGSPLLGRGSWFLLSLRRTVGLAVGRPPHAQPLK